MRQHMPHEHHEHHDQGGRRGRQHCDFGDHARAMGRSFGFPPPFGPFGPFGPAAGGGRVRGHGRRRANLRPALLALLLERPMHGYEMIQELESRTGGIWKPSPGSVYPTLQLLEDSGMITAEESGGRRRFTLTDAGRAEATTAAEAPPWAEYSDESVSQAKDFHAAMHAIFGALRQVGASGTDEQRTAALGVLNETKRRLYAILAEAE